MALRALSLAFVLLAAGAVHAQEAPPTEWTGRSAIPLPRHDGSVALFGESRFGLGHDLQLGAHLVGALAPHVSLLYRFAHHGRVHGSARIGLAYPHPLMAMLTGSGTLALLPVDRSPPQTVMVDLGARLTIDAGRGQWLTVESAIVVAPRLTDPDSTLLDFPFLYPRFAASESSPVARLGLTGEGVVAGPIRWVSALEAWFLPVVERGFAFEQRAGLAVVARRRVTAELGGRGSYARYPVGLRFHVTPYVDLRVRW